MALVSIGIPVYNGENFIEKAIESILDQDFGDFELNISDNASADGTENICRRYAMLDSRIRYERLPENRGASYNYNRVFRMSQGKYFKWAAHDDLVKPLFLSRCVARFEESEDSISVVYPRAEFVDEDGETIAADKDRQRADSDYAFVRAFRMLQAMNMAACVFGLFDRSKLEKTTLIGSFGASDYALLLQASFFGSIVQLEGEPLFQRRIHPEISRFANRSHADVLKWFDPSAKSRLSERHRLYLEYLKSPYLVKDIGVVTRMILLASVAGGIVVNTARWRLGGGRREPIIAGRVQVATSRPAGDH